MTRKRTASAPADRKPGPVLPADSVRRALFAALPGVLRQLAADPWIARRLPDPAFQAVLRQGLSDFIGRAPTLAAVGAYRDLTDAEGDPAGGPERTRFFLKRYLGLDPSPEHLEAFWNVVRQRGYREREIDPDGELPYLRKSIREEVRRARRDREMEDRLWARTRPLTDKLARVHCRASAGRQRTRGRFKTLPVREELTDSLLSEKDLIARLLETPPRDIVGLGLDRDAPRLLKSALARVCAAGLPPEQQEYLALRESGLSAGAAVERVGTGWSPHIALQQKILRCLKQRLAA